MRHTIVYRIYDAADELIYVGYSAVGLGRLTQHSSRSKWWPEIAAVRIEHFDNMLAALERETELIRSAKPRYNVAGARRYLNASPNSQPLDTERLEAVVAAWRVAKAEEREARSQFSVSIRAARADGVTLRELATDLGVSRERVRQLSL